MQFEVFLNNLCQKLNSNSATKLYKKLGGKKELSMGLRQFQSIYSGQAKPTITLLMAIIRNVDYELYHTAVISYFKSIASDNDQKFIRYLESGLRESIKMPANALWNNDTNIRLYTEEQITFLKSNPEVLRLHQKILLYNDIALNKEDRCVIDQLCKINLAKIDNDFIKSTADAFKIPTEFNSLPRTTRIASEYIIESMKTFLSFEGSENQKLEMVTQTISRADLPAILNESLKFKLWLQSLGQKETIEGNSIPFIYIGFTKGLVKGEII